MNWPRLAYHVRKPRESVVEDYFVKEVKRAGGWPIKMRLLGLAGFPDRLVIWKWGIIDLVELKRPKGKPRTSQVNIHKKLAAFGIIVHVLDTEEKVNEYIALI